MDAPRHITTDPQARRRQVLAAVKANPNASVRELAAATGIPKSAVHRHLDRLQAMGKLRDSHHPRSWMAMRN